MHQRVHERERPEHHARGLAGQQRQQLLGAGERARGRAVAVGRVHGVKARALGQHALLDHRVQPVGDLRRRQRPAVRVDEVGVDQIADSHTCTFDLAWVNATPASTTMPPPSAIADGACPSRVAVQNSANTGTRYMKAAVRLTGSV